MILLTAEFYNSSNKIIDVKLQNISKIENTENVQGNKTKISWGIISNTANAYLIDIEGNIFPILKSAKESSDILCKIYIQNTRCKKSEQIAEKYISNIKYDQSNKTIIISLKDELEEWQKINFEGFNYNTASSKSKSGQELYEYLWSKTPTKFNMCEFSLLNQQTREILSSTIINFPMMNSSTLWQAWDKFAKLFGAYIYKTMYKNSNGNLIYTTLFSLDYSVYGV